MPTVLVTGASGLLGREVQRVFQLEGWKSVGTALSRAKPPTIVKVDITNEEEIKKALDEFSPNVVVHCAANRFPDSCTANPDGARQLNVEASRTIASTTSSRSIFLIYISTDYVFSGRPGEAPYKADAATDPPNNYGQTKLDGEKAVLETATSGKAVVLRVPVLYGKADEPSESAVNTLLSTVWKAQELKAEDVKIKVDDYAQRFPTNTEDVARVCRDIATFYLKAENSQALPHILQFSSEDKMTKYDICTILAEILGLSTDGLEKHNPGEEAGNGVKRPYDCHLDTGELRKLGIDVSTIGFKTWWRRELGAFRK